MRWRSSSNTSSISWVSLAIAAKPIVALMPLSEWAIRKISSTVARSCGLSSSATIARLSSCEVLARLGEEHRHVLGGVHQAFL